MDIITYEIICSALEHHPAEQGNLRWREIGKFRQRKLENYSDDERKVADYNRNRWTISIGITARLQSEQVAD